MMSEPATYLGYCLPAVVIHQAVWLYHVFSLRLRDLELIPPSAASWSPTRASGMVPDIRHRHRPKAAEAPSPAG